MINSEVVVCVDCMLLYTVLSTEGRRNLSRCSIITFDLLQELTSWAAAEDEEKEDEQELDVSAMTLLEVEQQLLVRAARRGQRLTLLQVLAVMVESLQHTVLLRKTTQVSGEIHTHSGCVLNPSCVVVLFKDKCNETDVAG